MAKETTPNATPATSLLKTKADTQRPILHHLNADTSWLIQLPRNDNSPRPYLNILIDAWLTTPQIEFSRIFHEQSHTIPSAFQTIAQVEAFAREIELQACALRAMPVPDESTTGYIDVAACALRGTDHVNEHTLRQLHPSVPILIRHDAEHIVKGYNYFQTIELLPAFERDWRETRFPFLPDWVGIGCLTQKQDVQGIHKGLVVSFDSTGLGEAEAVVYMPHGIWAPDLAFLAERAPALRVTALIHGLLNVKVGLSWIGHLDANMGGHNGLKLQRMLDAKYWVPTHDEMKVEKGLTSLILSNELVTVEEALEREREEAKGEEREFPDPNFHAVENGESFVLV